MPAKTLVADRVEISWDAAKNKWLFRIQSGEEVIRRFSDLAKNADEQALRSAAAKAAQDEGYELDLARITVNR